MNHGGDPNLPPLLSIDAPDVKLYEPGTPDQNVLRVGVDFRLALTFELTGTLAITLVNSALVYTVTYAFSGLGIPDGPPLTKTGTTVPGKLTYADPETEVIVLANTLQPGLYSIAATVMFADQSGAPAPIAAFAELPLIHVF